MTTTNNIEDGWYDAKAKSWRWKQASTGTWQLEIWFTLSKDGHELGEMPGWFAVTDNTIAKRVEQFTALGYAPKTGDIGQEIGADEAGNCFGGLDTNTVRAVVKTEPDRNGVEKQKVDNIVAGGGGRGAGQTADAGAPEPSRAGCATRSMRYAIGLMRWMRTRRNDIHQDQI
jgi:hypothetical protein